MKKFIFLSTLFLSVSCFAAPQNNNNSDNLDKALEAAEEGNAQAQAALGEMYYEGAGVPQDFNEAAKWSLKAAEQGVRDAQAFMGIAYFLGIGVPKDFVQAHMWLNISSMEGNKEVDESRALVEKNMSKAEIIQAQKLANDWVLNKNKANIEKE